MVEKLIGINVHIKVEHLAIERCNSHEKRVIPRQTVTFQSDEREKEKKKEKCSPAYRKTGMHSK